MKSTNDKTDTAIYLEIIKAISLHNNRSSFSDEDIKYAHQAKSRLIKLIKETLQECIGEETLQTIEYKTVYGTPKTGKRKRAGWKIRNQLRQEALTKLEELLK